MTIPTPTSDSVPGAPGPSPFDVSTLATLANAFFQAIPGGAPVAGLSGGIPAPEAAARSVSPSSAGQALSVGSVVTPRGPAPSSLPTLPTEASRVPTPSEPSRIGVPRSIPGAAGGGTGLGGASLPADPARVPASASPFYFLDHSTARQGLVPVDDLATVGVRAMPGAGRLETLPAKLPAARTPTPDSGSPYYFLELARVVTDASDATPPATPSSALSFDVNAVRRDFPILAERVHGKPLIWLDNAATTQKPLEVIQRLEHFYRHENSNIHRAAHTLAARATDAYEAAREKVARFLGAGSPDEIVFVRGATEAINLVAQSWGCAHIGAGDEIIVSHLEHHANIVPWQQLAAEKGATLKVIPVDDDGQVRLDAFRSLLTPRTKLVSVTQVSNALGTIVPVAEIIAIAHASGVPVLVDGAQSVSHMPVNVRALDADFFVFSGHKVFGPTGIGVVYGKPERLAESPPWQGGGNMIVDVTFERTVFQPPPGRFEAGTGNIADAVGLGAAIDYVTRLGMHNIAAYEHGLLEYATRALKSIPGLRLIGTAAEKASVLSFVLEGREPVAIGKALDAEGIAVRAGHHCAQPILRRFGLEATVRPSLAFYNTCDEVDCLARALERIARH